MKELAISKEKLEGFEKENTEISEILYASKQNCKKIYETLISDNGSSSISAILSYRGSASYDLLIFYENLFYHLEKLENLFKTGSDYLKHCKQTVQNADEQIAKEVEKR